MIIILYPSIYVLEDEFVIEEEQALKYTLYVDYPNNNFWGSAHGYYYYGEYYSRIG